MELLTLAMLWLSVIVFAYIGVLFVVAPVRGAAGIELELKTPVARTDVRATYGGLMLGIGLLFAWAALDPLRHSTGLWAMAFVYGGFALGRGVGILVDGCVGRLMPFFLAAEVAFTGLSVWILMQS